VKDIREVYPKEIEPFYGPSDYRPLLESLGHEILLQVDDQDYQGDSRLLFRHGDRIGYLHFGWGSCSGCDALQACETYAQIEALRTELDGAINWWPSAGEALAWFESHDWEGDHTYHYEEQQRFVSMAKDKLRALLS